MDKTSSLLFREDLHVLANFLLYANKYKRKTGALDIFLATKAQDLLIMSFQ